MESDATVPPEQALTEALLSLSWPLPRTVEDADAALTRLEEVRAVLTLLEQQSVGAEAWWAGQVDALATQSGFVLEWWRPVLRDPELDWTLNHQAHLTADLATLASAGARLLDQIEPQAAEAAQNASARGRRAAEERRWGPAAVLPFAAGQGASTPAARPQPPGQVFGADATEGQRTPQPQQEQAQQQQPQQQSLPGTLAAEDLEPPQFPPLPSDPRATQPPPPETLNAGAARHRRPSYDFDDAEAAAVPAPLPAAPVQGAGGPTPAPQPAVLPLPQPQPQQLQPGQQPHPSPGAGPGSLPGIPAQPVISPQPPPAGGVPGQRGPGTQAPYPPGPRSAPPRSAPGGPPGASAAGPLTGPVPPSPVPGHAQAPGHAPAAGPGHGPGYPPGGAHGFPDDSGEPDEDESGRLVPTGLRRHQRRLLMQTAAILVAIAVLCWWAVYTLSSNPSHPAASSTRTTGESTAQAGVGGATGSGAAATSAASSAASASASASGSASKSPQTPTTSAAPAPSTGTSTVADGTTVSSVQVTLLGGSASVPQIVALITVHTAGTGPINVVGAYYGEKGGGKVAPETDHWTFSGHTSYQYSVPIANGPYCGSTFHFTLTAGGVSDSGTTSPGC